VPVHFRLLQSPLPRNQAGKLVKQALRKAFER
jgi:hypothetical protein